MDGSDTPPTPEIGEPFNAASSVEEAWLSLPILDRKAVAYRTGRLTNLLRWRMVPAFFFCSRRRWDEVDWVAGKLKRVADILPSAAAHTIESEIEKAMRRWHADLCSEQRDISLDLLHDEQELCRQCRSFEEYYETLIADWIDSVVEEVREAFPKQLTPSEQWILRLGELVDQGVRRPDLHSFLGLPVHDNEDGRWEIEVTYGEPGDLPPKGSWFSELPDLCSMAGITDALAGVSLTLGPQPTRNDVWDLVERVDGAIRGRLERPQLSEAQASEQEEGWTEGSLQTEATAPQSSAELPPLTSGYLGLQFDYNRRRKVTREGCDQELYLADSPLCWAVLLKLNEQRDQPISSEGLRNVWKEHGYDDSPEDGTIIDLIYRLRKKLLVLDVAPTCIRKVGYMLVPIDGEPKPSHRKNPSKGTKR